MIGPMAPGVVCRTGELGEMADFLTSACARPSGLTIEGEAGIGKTTLWSAATDQARERGFCFLSARAGEAESAIRSSAQGRALRDADSENIGSHADHHLLRSRRRSEKVDLCVGQRRLALAVLPCS